MKSLVIFNPRAGNGKAERSWPQWQSRLRQAIGTFDTVATEFSGHGERLAQKALREGYEHIHVLGGDGTANEVVAGFFEYGRPIRPETLFSVWPAGTACDFHRGLQRPDVFKNQGEDGIFRIDVGRLTFLDHEQKSCEKYVLNIASCGISGFVDQLMAKKWKTLGSLGFFLNTIEGLMRYENKKVRIKTDRGDLGETPIRLAVIANGPYFGAGMKIAPAAQIDDGKFQLVVLGDISLLDALMHTPQLYRGEHMHHPKIQTQNVTWVELTSDESVLVDLDGEPFGTLPLRVQIVPSSLRLKTY